MVKYAKDLTGQQFGRLTVIRRAEHDRPGTFWLCQCNCDPNQFRIVNGAHLKNGHTKSCGCYHRDQASAGNKEIHKKEDARTTTTHTYRHRRSLGLCPLCGNKADEPGRVICSVCREKSKPAQSKHRASKRHRRKQLGMCAQCGGQRESTQYAACNKCREYARTKSKAWRNGNDANELCPCCHQPRPEGAKVCPDCLTRLRQTRQDRIFAGLCCRCGAPAQCGKKWLVCEPCWFKIKASQHTGSTKNWKALKAILDAQEWKCFYTGVPLVVGENLSLDHAHPRAKGGMSSLCNLQWVCKEVNLMKNDLTHEAFVRFCHLIAERFALPVI